MTPPSDKQFFRTLVGEANFDIAWTGNEWTINDIPAAISFEKVSGACYSLILDGQSLPVVVRGGKEGPIQVTIEGQTVDVILKDRIALLQERFQRNDAPQSTAHAIQAPMPGLVLDVRVRPGETVRAGDGLLVLEAMKMENELNAPQDGVIQAVHVTTGDAVVRHALLIELEPTREVT